MFYIIVTGKPSAPECPKVTEISRDFVSLVWTEPDSDGGSPITGYVIERKDDTKNNWILASHVNDASCRSTEITNLFEGTTYNFRVAAENKIGTGEFANIPESVTA